MKNRIIYILVAIVFALFQSCQTDEDLEPIYTFDFSSPWPGNVYDFGDTIHITGQLGTNQSVDGWQITITNTSIGNVIVFEESAMGDGVTAIPISERWINNVVSKSDMKLEISFIKDMHGNKETKEIMFICKPL